MDFALFILLNAILLIRPEELWPEFAGMRLYQIMIGLCSVVALPDILGQLRPDELRRRPITVCVLGMLGAVALSVLARGRMDDFEEFVPEFAKVILYYLLLVAVVTTPMRLRIFLGAQVVFIAIVAGLALMQFHEYIDIETLRPVVDHRIDPETGVEGEILRMRSTGIFNDPNDLCLILVFGSVCCLYLASTAAPILVRGIALLPVPVFGYALYETGSRGGLLSLLAAAGALLWMRLGSKRSLPLIALLPVLLLVLGGRQSEITGGTAHERVMIWADGLSEYLSQKAYVLTGLGPGQYDVEMGHVAHNSFVHAYVELGLIGGGFFLGAFVLAVRMMLHVKSTRAAAESTDAIRAMPFIAAILAGYCAGVYSLSRCYVVPTYMCLGLVASYLSMVMQDVPIQFQVTGRWVRDMVLISVGGLVFLKVFTQVAGNLGM
jgi:putative inorganic carbon (HCO3(-)) transporter